MTSLGPLRITKFPGGGSLCWAIGDANNNVLQGATIIGKRVSNGFGTKELIITFNTNSTPAVVQQLVRAITFKTVGGAAGQRKVIFTISDGDGGLSNESAKLVNVT